jgi:hypothetical protein
MADEEKLSEQIDEYAKIAKEHKEVDVTSLMMNALEQAQRDEVQQANKRKAYMVSVFLPPFGYLFALWYFFSDRQDARQVALNCAILTSVTLLMTLLIGKAMFASIPQQSASQIQNVNVSELLKGAQQLREVAQ